MYKQILGTLAIAVALAGCSDKSDQQAADAAPQKSADGASGLATAPVAPPQSTEFPSGLTPAFAYQLRSKKTEDQGAERYRKLVIEFQQANTAEVDKSIESSLLALGYRRYKTIEQPNGGLVGDYGRKGHRITVTTTPVQPGAKLLNPASEGTVYFVWKES